MSHSQTTTPTPGKTRRKTAFAVGAVIALVGVAFAATMYYTHEDEPIATSDFGFGGDQDPASSLAALAAPLPSVDSAAAGAFDHSANAQAEATASVEASIAQAQATVDGAAAQASDLLAGTDGGIQTHLGGLYGYDVGGLQAQLDSYTGSAFFWSHMPSTVYVTEDGVHFNKTGTAEVDEVLLQVEALIAQIQVLYGSSEVQTLFATADETTAGAGLPVSIPGLVKSPFGANGAVEPDEQGALDAQAHAEAMLSTVGSGYGSLSTGLDDAAESQAEIVGQVDAALAAAGEFRADATAAVNAEFDGRVNAVHDTAANYEALLTEAAEAYVASVESAAASAEADLDATVEEQLAAIEAGAAEAQSRIDAQLDTVRSEADARLAAIAEAEASVKASSASAADIEAYLSATAAATSQIEGQLAGAEAAAAGARAQLAAQAAAHQVAIVALADDARADLDARVSESTTWAEAQIGVLQADVESAVESAVAAQADLRAAAEASIDDAVAAHRAELQARAYGAISDARAYAESAQAVVAQVQGEAYAEVGNDLAYIQAVAEDYGSVPTPERQAAAEAWTLVQSQVDGTLGAVLFEGSQIGAQAEAVLSAAAQAEAALDARF